MTGVLEDAAALLARFAATESVVVAYSGGADSALVLAAAVRALGADKVMAVTAVSESLASGELRPAQALAASLGVVHLTPRTRELARPEYRANDRNRCYFCKSEVLGVITDLAAERGFTAVATGTNADDARDPFRPGIRAGAEKGVMTPLRDAELTKHRVRRLSRHWSLPTWDKPASPCLASRVAYGLQISATGLRRIDHAETAVRAALAEAGIEVSDLRVRGLGDDTARIEVPADRIAAVFAVTSLPAALASAGFDAAVVALAVFRSGVLNTEEVGALPALPALRA